MWLLIGLSILLVWLLYKYYASIYDTYWKKRGIPSCPSIFPFGSDPNFITMRKFHGLVMDQMYHKFAPSPLFGYFLLTSPILVVRDLELIRLILTKQFSNFRDRQIFKFDESDVLSQNLFNLDGERWRALRVKLTPAFSSGKLKAMFSILHSCAESFSIMLSKKADSVVDIKEITGRFTTDIICNCAFGLDTDTINDPNHKLRKVGIESLTVKPLDMLKLIFLQYVPPFSQFFSGRFHPIERERYIVNLIKTSIDHRENNGIKRNDFLDLLIQLKNKGNVGEDMKDEIEEKTCVAFEMTTGIIAAQCFLFFGAGFDNSSSAQSFCLYELALNQDIQNRLRKEIKSTIEIYGGLTYQAIKDMIFLDMVLSETMRKYPTLVALFRRCTKSFTTPEGYKIEKDDKVFIPIWSLQHDPEYFPNPDKFDPERFSSENKELIKPFTYLPFGEGPRICIAMRFAQLQTKVGLITILRKFRVEPCKETKIPIEFAGSPMLTIPKDPIMLKLVDSHE